MNPSSDYAGCSIALLTQHGKERVITPLLDSALGCRVERVSGFDTDQLGTFTREIPRPGSQLEAARKKARIGMELSGQPLGLASEGAFGPDPFTGMFPWNVEIVLFIDDLRGLEIAGVAQGKSGLTHTLATNWNTAESFATQAGFPEHHLVVRPQHENDPRIRKNLSTWPDLRAAFQDALAQAANGQVFLESDVRAHANPTRMANIRLAAENLLAKLRSACPACGLPGFDVVEHEAGLPCADCGAPTRETRADILGCVKCAHRERRPRAATATDPSRCDFCNP